MLTTKFYHTDLAAPYNKEILGYNFPEDGASVAEMLHLGDSNLPANYIDGEERPILAELEGIVINSPHSAKKVINCICIYVYLQDPWTCLFEFHVCEICPNVLHARQIKCSAYRLQEREVWISWLIACHKWQ